MTVDERVALMVGKKVETKDLQWAERMAASTVQMMADKLVVKRVANLVALRGHKSADM